MPATDLDRVKRLLRIPAGITVHDARITEIVGESDGELLALVGLDSWDAATAYTDSLDVYPGTAGQVLLLRRWPVTAVVALTAGGAGLVEGVDFRVDRGGVLRLLGTRTLDAGTDAAQCTYTAGHVSAGSTPTWLLRLGSLAAARQYNTEAMAGIGDLRVDPVTKAIADFDHDAAEREIARTLARWSRP